MTTTLGTQTPEITQSTLVFRTADQSVEPLIGRVVGLGDDAFMVAWGDARHLPDVEALEQAQVVELSDLVAWTAAESQRRGYIAGLRQMADVLEQHPVVPLPVAGSLTDLSICFLDGSADNRTALAQALQAFPGTKAKDVRDYADGTSYFDVSIKLHGLKVKLTAFRNEVCERIVTGTREVTKDVPDPDALAAVPTITVTETVEDVEWVCGPLLASAPVSA